MDGDDIRERTAPEDGFTLIELMTVVLIIAILIAVALPTFLGARGRATDRHAQSLVRDGVLAGRIASADGANYSTISTADLHDAERELRFVGPTADAAAPSQEVSVASGGSGAQSYLLLASGSASGSCFAALMPMDGGPRFDVRSGSGCTANDFDPSSGSWQDQWP